MSYRINGIECDTIEELDLLVLRFDTAIKGGRPKGSKNKPKNKKKPGRPKKKRKYVRSGKYKK